MALLDPSVELVGSPWAALLNLLEDASIGAVGKLLRKYRDTPMSLADACIVRMAEIHDGHAVLTLDSDFSIYRKHGRIPISLIQAPAD